MTESNMNAVHVCPKCNGQMIQGKLRGDSTVLWSQIKESKIFGVTAIQTVGTTYTVDAYRCEQCAYLELYAAREAGNKNGS